MINITDKQKILDVIDAYANEPQDGSDHYEIRAIPSPEVLADWIIENLTDV